MTNDPNTSSSPIRAIDTPRLTAEEIETLLIDGQRDFSGTNWMGLDFDELTNWELDGINFTKACLLGITTRSLTNSILIDADIRNACFVLAYLDNTDFTGANLEGANFRGANLNGVDFTYTSGKGRK